MAKLLLACALVLAAGPLGPARAEGPPAAEAVDESTPVAVPEPSREAMEFYRTGMLLWGLDRAWAIALPAVVLLSGASARLRDFAARFGGGWVAAVAIYVPLYLLIAALASLPLHYYEGYVRLHAYGLSNQSLARWAGNRAKWLAIDAGVGVLIAWGVYGSMRWSPRRWWLFASLGAVPFLFATMLVMPIWIDPLFNAFGPMQDKALERSILDLASRAGIESGRVFEVDKSADTNAMNAYVTGFLGSKRIVLWDTLLAKMTGREVLCVMAHEMGHYVLGHVVRSILLSFVVILASLYFVHRTAGGVIARGRGRFGFAELRDPASVPLVLLLLQVASLFLAPAALAYSRRQEHEADRFAVELTGWHRSGASAFAKLQRENLSNPRPGWVYRTFRATHPSLAERIGFWNTHRPAAGPLRADPRDPRRPPPTPGFPVVSGGDVDL